MDPVSPQRWKQVEALLDAALDQDPEFRDAWLQQQCDEDPALYSDVSALLASSQDIDGRFEEPAAISAAEVVLDGLHDPLQGQTLGPYRLGDEIGRGGMGVVYRAERGDGQFTQAAVVKILRQGIDDEGGQRRFRQERQILANLRHDNIAQLLDGGVAPDGRPFIVLEPVDGQPIDVYCQESGASVEQRLELFLQVIDAVHHAHQNLTVHRDLKPSNILVTGDGRAKLLDFGIAKMLMESGQPGLTLTQHPLMTPEYASPEQVRGEPITTASDVYQLGVVLYQILTGALPYKVEATTPFEIGRAICDTEPATPSRATVSGDLQKILLKALEKDPARRYGSAREMGQDIQRHLGGHPVMARGDSWAYRIQKFAGRNRVAVGAAVVLVVGIISFGTFHTVRVSRERDRAQGEAAQREEISRFLVEMFSTPAQGNAAAGDITGRELVELALARIDEDRPEVRARMLAVIGEAATNLGLVAQALEPLEESDRLIREVHGPQSLEAAESAIRLVRLHQTGRSFAQAIPLAERAVRIYREARPRRARDLANALSLLATSRRDAGDPVQAEKDIRESIRLFTGILVPTDPDLMKLQDTLGYILRALGKDEEAEAIYRETIAYLRDREERDDEWLAGTLHNLAFLVRERDPEDAIALYREALDLKISQAGDAHPTTRLFRRNLAGALSRHGETDEAISHFVRLVELAEQIEPAGHWRIGSAYFNLASIQVRSGRAQDAETNFRRCVDLWRASLGSDNSWTASGEAWLAYCLYSLGGAEESGRLRRRCDPILDTPDAVANNDVWFRLQALAGSWEALDRPDLAQHYRDMLEVDEPPTDASSG